MKVNGFDLDVREASVLIEQNGTTPKVCNVEACLEELVVNILNCFLQGDDMPLACDLLLNSAFSYTPRPWISVVDAEPFSIQVIDWARCCRSGTPETMYRVSFRMPRENMRRPFEHQPYVVLM